MLFSPYASVASLTFLSLSSFAKDSPNIILILADDQEWNDLSVPMDPKIDGSRSDYI